MQLQYVPFSCGQFLRVWLFYPPPPKKSIWTWQIFLTSLTQHIAGSLVYPLGKWLPHERTQQWHYCILPDNALYWVEANTPPRKFDQITIRSLQYSYHTHQIIKWDSLSLPEPDFGDVLEYDNTIICMGRVTPQFIQEDHTPEAIPPDLHAEIKNLPKQSRCLLGKITFPDDGGHYLAQELVDGYLIEVSNGSVKKGLGSHAWVLMGCKEDILFMSGMGPIDGDSATISTYRTEMQGQVAICICTSLLAQTFGTKGEVTTACNNKGTGCSMQQLSQPHWLKNHKDPDTDFLMLVWA